MGLLQEPPVWAAGAILALLALYFVFSTPRIRRHGVPLKLVLRGTDDFVTLSDCNCRKPPNTLPLVGNGILFLQARQKLFTWFAKCERQLGHETFQITVPTLPPGVVINDPRNLEFVYKNEGIFTKGDFVKGALRDLFGKFALVFGSYPRASSAPLLNANVAEEVMASSTRMANSGRFSARLGSTSSIPQTSAC